MKNTLTKFFSLLFLFVFTLFSYAQMEGCDTCPPSPEGDGTHTTPIDEYAIYLIGFAILIGVAYFSVKKYKKSLI
ncbi:hypothetical protein ACTS94_13900 [Empedobacter falsenii]